MNTILAKTVDIKINIEKHTIKINDNYSFLHTTITAQNHPYKELQSINSNFQTIITKEEEEKLKNNPNHNPVGTNKSLVIVGKEFFNGELPLRQRNKYFQHVYHDENFTDVKLKENEHFYLIQDGGILTDMDSMDYKSQPITLIIYEPLTTEKLDLIKNKLSKYIIGDIRFPSNNPDIYCNINLMLPEDLFKKYIEICYKEITRSYHPSISTLEYNLHYLLKILD